MAKRSKTPKLPSRTPNAAQKLYDRFPVARGDDTAAYEGLARTVMEALQPQDVIEEILARDVADHTWEVQLLRSIEATMLTPESAPSQRRFVQSQGPPNIDELMDYFSTPAEVFRHRPRG